MGSRIAGEGAVMTVYKACEIADCPGEILSPHRQDDGAHLCACHFYALASIESSYQPLDMPEGPRRRYFINAVRLISTVQRLELLAWREKNSAGARRIEA